MSNPARIIGLLGHAGSGKDTAARFILELVRGRSIALADPLKRFCKEVFAFSNEQLWGLSEKREVPDKRYIRTFEETPIFADVVENSPPRPSTFLTPRYALQTLGTDWGRACYQDVWIDLGLRTAMGIIGNGTATVVITDVRFVNEARKIQEAGGVVWQIVRSGVTGASGGIVGHASEVEQDSVRISQYVSYTIDNNSDLDALRERLKDLLANDSRWKGLCK